MNEQNERRMFGRRRRANVPQDQKRGRRYEVSVNQDEDVQLQARAIAAGVTVPRFLFESAMSAHVETDTDRKAAIAELFKLRRDMAGVAANVNQLPSGRTKSVPSRLTRTLWWPSTGPSSLRFVSCLIGSVTHDPEHHARRSDDGLMVYLAGEGRENEHTEQHLVAGDSAIVTMYGYDALDRNTALAIAHDLDEPRVLYGVDVQRKVTSTDKETGEARSRYVGADVWHCSLSLGADDGHLSDEKWGEIAQQFVDRMGFTEASGKAPCRWVAVRHGLSKNGNDHVHIAVSLVREDGTKASVHMDQPKAQRACRELEREHGLTQLAQDGRTLGGARDQAARAVPGTPPGRRGGEPPARTRGTRSRLASVDEGEFVRRLRRAVSSYDRASPPGATTLAGYSVALRPEKDEPVVWHGGGKLARDLTLPRLREGWPDSPQSAQAAVDEWRATSRNPWRYQPVAPGREVATPDPSMWKQYTDDLRQMRAQMQSVPIEDRAGWRTSHATPPVRSPRGRSALNRPPGHSPRPRATSPVPRTPRTRVQAEARRGVSSAGATALLMAASTGGKGSMAEALMLRQLAATAKAVMDMHSAAGDLRRAQQIDQTLREQYTAVRDRLPSLRTATATPPATPAPVDRSELTAEQRQAVEAVERSNARPGVTGSPVPNRLDPPRRTAPTVTPNERDGQEQQGR